MSNINDGSQCDLPVTPERSKSQTHTVRTTKTIYSHSDLDKKKAQAYIYQNFGYDINEAGSFPSNEAQQHDELLGNTLNTNKLNNSMQDMENAFHELNAFTDAELARKRPPVILGRNRMQSCVRSQAVFENLNTSQMRAVPFRNGRGHSVRIMNNEFDFVVKDDQIL